MVGLQKKTFFEASLRTIFRLDKSNGRERNRLIGGAHCWETISYLLTMIQTNTYTILNLFVAAAEGAAADAAEQSHNSNYENYIFNLKY